MIQFLNRENNDKNITIGKIDLFNNSMGLCGNFTENFGFGTIYTLSKSDAIYEALLSGNNPKQKH